MFEVNWSFSLALSLSLFGALLQRRFMAGNFNVVLCDLLPPECANSFRCLFKAKWPFDVDGGAEGVCRGAA
jgi:hypothetical protein